MKYINVQRIWKDPFYARYRKHFCPKCGEQMAVARRDAVLTPEQAESRGFRPDATGRTKYIWDIFECPGCGHTVTIEDMKRQEKEKC